MDSAGHTLEQAKIVGRIRDALRGLGYAVPAGGGLGTPAQLAALAPAIAAFAKTLAPVFVKRLAAEKDPMKRAATFAMLAEQALAMAKGPTTQPHNVEQTVQTVKSALGVLAAGFVAFRAVKKKAGGNLEDVKIGDIMEMLTARTLKP